MHEPKHEVRDAIYGFVSLSEAEWAVVNCPEFQRLRDIRQLAMGFMVYPGANHTRFEHSLGCMHLATLMFNTLRRKNQGILAEEFKLSQGGVDRARQLLRLAALLHDIGHPPFSHSGESLLPDGGKGERLNHEEMTARIIRSGKLCETLNEYFDPDGITVEQVIAIATEFSRAQDVNPSPQYEFLHELLTGELGADRVDYLLRDAYHSGQKAGDFDYRRLVDSLTLVRLPKEDGQGHKIGFDSGGWLVAEQMIVARYLMYQSLYFHKTKRIYEIHLERFMGHWLQKECGLPTLPTEVAQYVSLSDSDVLGGLHKAWSDAEHPGYKDACRFRDRSHLRLAKEVILADNLDPNSETRRHPCQPRFNLLKSSVREKFGHQVLCDSPDHSAAKMFAGASQILVQLDGKTRYLENISEIVLGMSSRIWRGRVYAEPSIRKEVASFCEDWLAEHPTSGFKRQDDDNGH